MQLNYRDSKPIYEQVKDGIRKLVISNVIKTDEKLPSVREMAAKYAINPNTIARAYKELEEEGYLYTQSGKGTFAADAGNAKKHRAQELKEEFDDVVAELVFLSTPLDELKRRIDQNSAVNKCQHAN